MEYNLILLFTIQCANELCGIWQHTECNGMKKSGKNGLFFCKTCTQGLMPTEKNDFKRLRKSSQTSEELDLDLELEEEEKEKESESKLDTEAQPQTIHDAASAGDLKALQAFLQEDEDLINNRDNEDGATPLMLAAEAGRPFC